MSGMVAGGQWHIKSENFKGLKIRKSFVRDSQLQKRAGYGGYSELVPFFRPGIKEKTTTTTDHTTSISSTDRKEIARK